MGRTEFITKKTGVFSKIIEALIYLIIINLSYLLPMYIDITEKYTKQNFLAYKGSWIYLTIISLLIMLFNKMFHTLKLSKTENVFIVFTSTTMCALATTTVAFFARSLALPRSIIVIGFGIQTIMFILIKITMKVFYNKTKKEKNVAVFCPLNMAEEVVEKLFGGHDNENEKLIFISELEKFDMNNLDNINKIYIYDIHSSDVIEKIIHNCILKGIQICVLPKSYELSMKNASFYLKSDVPLIKINQVGLSIEYRIIKRSVDIIFSVIGILIFSPIMIIIAICIFLFDDKQVIYKQKRVTVNNKIFNVYKFRTMIVDAEKNTGAVWSSDNDNRVTKVGKILRKYWLDELPQLFNILKGDMSIVGPRPERPELIREFVKSYPDFKFRTIVKGGLTGYAQVMAKYDTTPEYKLKFDLFYILNANLLFDINIIIMTLRKILLRLLGHEKKWIRYDEILKEWDIEDIVIKDTIMYYRYN